MKGRYLTEKEKSEIKDEFPSVSFFDSSGTTSIYAPTSEYKRSDMFSLCERINRKMENESDFVKFIETESGAYIHVLHAKTK